MVRTHTLLSELGLLTNGATSQAELSDGQTDEAALIRFKPMPLNENVERGQTRWEVVRDVLSCPLSGIALARPWGTLNALSPADTQIENGVFGAARRDRGLCARLIRRAFQVAAYPARLPNTPDSPVGPRQPPQGNPTGVAIQHTDSTIPATTTITYRLCSASSKGGLVTIEFGNRPGVN